MKKFLILIMVIGFFGNNSIAQSAADQNNSEYTKSEKLLDATIICMDAIEAPTKYNEFAKQFLFDSSNKEMFPSTEAKTREEFQAIISNWLKDNPMLIDKILIERKKTHDILYGPRPY